MVLFPVAMVLTAARQSKLSQDQLMELQKSTHFDKRELQQWYKGVYPRHPACLSHLSSAYAH